MGPAWRPRATQPLGVMLSAATPSPEWLTRHPGPELALRCSELSPGELPVLLASPQTGGSSRCRFVDDRMPRATPGGAKPRQSGAQVWRLSVSPPVLGIALLAGGPLPFDVCRSSLGQASAGVPPLPALVSRSVGVARWKCLPPAGLSGVAPNADARMDELLPMPRLPSLSQESYERTVWPALERGVESLLLPDAAPQSHEVLYRAVHNACCCGLEQRIEADLLACITRHSSAIARRLPSQGDGLAGMHDILGPILVVFAYLDREYLSGRLESCMTQLVLQQMHASPPAAAPVPAAPTTGAEALAPPLSEPAPSPAKQSRPRRQTSTRTNGSASKRLRSGSSSAR